MGKCGLCAAEARLASFRKAQAAKAPAAKPVSAAKGTGSAAGAASRPAAANPVTPPITASQMRANAQKSADEEYKRAIVQAWLFIIGAIIAIIWILSH